MKDIFKNLSYYCSLLVVADTQVDGDKTDEVKVAEETIKLKNVQEFALISPGVWFPGPREGG